MVQRIAGFMRTYWTRGTPGRPTPRSLSVFMQRMWLLALTFKLIGSSWDVSWHFKWLRDDFAPPHLINTIGTGIAIGLVLSHTFTGYGADRTSLRLMQWGTGIFVVAGPIDVINHRVNGLDLTAWSPSHLLLYFGTMVMVVGVVRNWYRSYPRDLRILGRVGQWSAGLVLLFGFLFEDVFFPTGQQEYGILEVASWIRGTPYAEPSLLSFAARQLGRPVDDVALQHFAMPIPPWVYPVWVLTACVLVLVVARITTGVRWAATMVVALYVAYRCVIWPLLVVGTFPSSSLPLWLLPVGVAVDVVFLARANAFVRAVLGAVVVTAVGYGTLWLAAVITGTPADLGQQSIAGWRADLASGAQLLTPPIAWWSAWVALPLLATTWCAVVAIAQRRMGLDSARPPELQAAYEVEPERDAHGRLYGWAADRPPAPSTATPRPGPVRTG